MTPLAITLLLSCVAPTESGRSRVLWSVPLVTGGMQPAVDATTAYFGTWRHEIVAVDRLSAAIKWRRVLSSAAGYTMGFEIQPVGEVIVATDVGLHAMNASDGSIRWRFERGGQQIGVSGIPTDGTRIFASAMTDGGPTYSIDVLSGALQWEVRLSADPLMQTRGARYHDGTVYVGFARNAGPLRGGLAALEAATGRIKWMKWLPPVDSARGADGFGGAVVFQETVIVAMGDGRLHALNRVTGDIVWTTPPSPTNNGPVDSRRLALAGDVVVAASTSGWLTGYDARTGAQRWHAAHRDHNSTPYPLETDGTLVYSVDVTGQLAAFDGATGVVRWRSGGQQPPDDYQFAAAVDDQAVYVHGLKAAYALRKDQ